MTRTIGRWELREKLGQGAMGVVWSAWDTSLGRLVAIKLLHPNADVLAHERLRREAKGLARVRHPNVVSVHEAGVHERTPFVVMELVQGKPLSELIRERAPREELLVALEEAARGLAAAHEAGIVHRDVKSSNILVDAERTRIADFGLVRMDDSSRALTASSALLGTPLYMAPELAEPGRAIGPAADVFSLGVVLFEILAGEPPLAGAPSILAILEKLTNDEPFPAPSSREPEARPWDELCAAALEKDPARRIATATAFADELAAIRRGDARVRSPHGRRTLAGLGLAALVVGLASSAFALRTRPASPAPPPSPPPPSPLSPLPEVKPEPKAPRVVVEPAWFRELEHRPAELPPGVVFGKERGEYVNEKDGTILVWVAGGKPFFIGKTEVTIEQFARFARATSYTHLAAARVFEPTLHVDLNASWSAPYGRGIKADPREPVQQVSWHDAKAYADWAGLRLPRVHEWVRAAYVEPGTSRRRMFPWGDELDGISANDRDRAYDFLVLRRRESSRRDDGFPRAAPVGAFPQGASPVGALDMHGNAGELCEPDESIGDPRYADPFHGDPGTRLPEHFLGEDRIEREACLLGNRWLVRVLGTSWRRDSEAFEWAEACGSASEDMGFRLVRDP